MQGQFEYNYSQIESEYFPREYSYFGNTQNHNLSTGQYKNELAGIFSDNNRFKSYVEPPPGLISHQNYVNQPNLMYNNFSDNTNLSINNNIYPKTNNYSNKIDSVSIYEIINDNSQSLNISNKNDITLTNSNQITNFNENIILSSPKKLNKNKVINENCLNLEIKNWASSFNKLDIMIDNYNKTKSRWENSSISTYVKIVIEYLCKYVRYDMLEYLRVNNPLFSNLNFSEDFYPFHELVWLNEPTYQKFTKSKFFNKNTNEIKLTFHVLIKMGLDKYILSYKNYTKDCDVNSENLEDNNKKNYLSTKNKKKYENFLMTLVHKYNKVDSVSKNELYNYFVHKWDNLYLLQDFINRIINESNLELQQHYFNDVIYFIDKYDDKAIKIIVLTLSELIDSSDINKKNSSKIYEFIFGICVEPSQSIYEKINKLKYYITFKNNIVNIILNNYISWIENKVYEDYVKLNDSSQNILLDELISKYFNNVMRILGYFYKLDINKENIISNLNFLIESSIENIEISLLFFIQCSELDIKNLDFKETKFIKDYLNKFYKSNIKNKIYIKKTFYDLTNTTYSFDQIDELLN